MAPTTLLILGPRLAGIVAAGAIQAVIRGLWASFVAADRAEPHSADRNRENFVRVRQTPLLCASKTVVVRSMRRVRITGHYDSPESWRRG